MKTSKSAVVVVGAGYWGKNLVRNFSQLGALAGVCDERPEALAEAERQYGVKTSIELENFLADPTLDAVVIAVPAAQHYEVAKRCLMRDKDVYVEKPLALHASEGKELIDLAAKRHRILMVGHILEYHPAIVELKRLISEGELGRIQYIYSSRLNLGKLRTEENILWSFAPHDISAILFLLGEKPTFVSSHGGTYLNRGIMDTTLTNCEFKSGVNAHIFVSWLHPFKEQKFAIVGDKKMAVFDDMEDARKLVLYSHRINWVDRVPVAEKASGQVLTLPKQEPLCNECEHFLECIRTRQAPRTSGESALNVLEVLEACESSAKQGGRPVEIGRAPIYQAHPSAVIDPDCEIGEGTRIWHFSHIMGGSRLGRHCNLGQNVVISPGVRIGDNVKIQNNVSVYTGVELEDDVFCGPSMVFTNVINPRSHINRKHEYRRTLVCKGASIGANSTIVCGVTLGKYCFIGAGAVITKDVPDYALMVGVPARQAGWVCYCGARLPQGTKSRIQCSDCGRSYTLEGNTCRDISDQLLPGAELSAVECETAACLRRSL
jgi:UDP-2-acetamido-3-amino-2,3-dideoxy-glucuronate N-acetyltransferase